MQVPFCPLLRSAFLVQQLGAPGCANAISCAVQSHMLYSGRMTEAYILAAVGTPLGDRHELMGCV